MGCFIVGMSLFFLCMGVIDWRWMLVSFVLSVVGLVTVGGATC